MNVLLGINTVLNTDTVKSYGNGLLYGGHPNDNDDNNTNS